MASEVERTPTGPGLVPRSRSRAGLGRIGLTARERRLLLIAVDLLMLSSALVAAVTLWDDFHPSWPVLLDHWKWFVTLAGIWLAVGVILDVYNLVRAASTTNTIASVALAAALTSLVYLGTPWLTPPILTRSYAFGFVLFSTISLTAWRGLYARALLQPAFHHRALVVRVGGASPALVEALQQEASADDTNPFQGTGYHIIGIVTDRPTASSAPIQGVPTLGGIGQLVHLAHQHAVDEIIVAFGDGGGLASDVYDVLLDCLELGLSVNRLSDVYERQTGRLPIEYAQYDLHLLLGSADSLALRLYAGAKRAMDLALASVGLCALACVAPAVALLNLVVSRGPLFYRQQRVGKGGQSFAVLKFRSMAPDSERDSGAVWCEDRDPRVTPVGEILRRTHLDELPQVLNVLRGEMSIVGPRPERPHFVGQLARALPLYRARHAVKPGLTGWAQVHYRYGNSVEDARIKLEYDLYYVKHASLFLDLLTVLHTVRSVLGLQGR